MKEKKFFYTRIDPKLYDWLRLYAEEQERTIQTTLERILRKEQSATEPPRQH